MSQDAPAEKAATRKETDYSASWISGGFYKKVNELLARDEPFASATVVKTEGSTIGKTGFKAIVRPDQTILGYVGGSCVDVAIVETALEAMKDGQTRTIDVELEEEEKGGLGPPCGGRMQIYVEPHMPRENLLVFSAPGEWSISTPLVKLGKTLGFHVTIFEPQAHSEKYVEADEIIADDSLLKFDKVKIHPRTYIVLAARHGYDVDVLRKIIDSEAAYIGVIGSKKRIKWIFDKLSEDGVTQAKLQKIIAPVGMDIGAETPEEIAISIMADIVRVKRGGTGRPLKEIKEASTEPVSVPSP